MNSSHEKTFGIVIAYLLPGFVAVRGIGYLSVDLSSWLAVDLRSEPVLAGFLFVGMASLTLGLIISGLRWAILDTLHHWTGIRPPAVDYALLQDNLQAFELAVEHNYRYYQFYANMSLAMLLFVGCWVGAGRPITRPGLTLAGVVVLELTLIWASRDCLKRYYGRIEQILRAGTRVRRD